MQRPDVPNKITYFTTKVLVLSQDACFRAKGIHYANLTSYWLLNKPYVNEGTLREKNLISFELIIHVQ